MRLGRHFGSHLRRRPIDPQGPPHRDALFVSAGDNHRLNDDLHRGWGFDIVIAWYGSDPRVGRSLEEMADVFFAARGGKFQNLWNLWRSGEFPVQRYESIFVVDDDLDLSGAQISNLFQRRREFDALIMSPAHVPWGAISYPALLYRPTCDRHFTNFIEVNTPLFEVQALLRFLREFDGSLSGWGIDHWYMNVIGEGQDNRFIVDDRVTFFNPRSRVPDGEREIDRIESMDARVEAWERARNSRGLREIRPTVVGTVPAPFVEATVRTFAQTLSLFRRMVGQPLDTAKALRHSVRLIRRSKQNR